MRNAVRLIRSRLLTAYMLFCLVLCTLAYVTARLSLETSLSHTLQTNLPEQVD